MTSKTTAATTSCSPPLQPSWISRLLSRPENAFMCDVDESFVRDKFNLTGLDELVPDFERALRIVLDECRDGSGKTADSAEASAKLLYGLVHARFVMTPRGVAKMIDKYAAGCFGRCPRVNCERSPVLPIGLSDTVLQHTVRLYCPRCTDVYEPPSGATGATVDGAYFGTGFPEMVFMTQPEWRPPRPKGRHVCRLYGFRVHPTGCDLQRREAAKHKRGGDSQQQNAAATTYRRRSTDVRSPTI